MATFDDREKAFEAKYAHDQEMQFKLAARRNKLFAQWAADKLDIAETDRDAFVGAVIASDLQEPGDADILRKVKADFESASFPISDEELAEQLEEASILAKTQLAAENS
jgi:hypothetical protein